MEQAYHTMTDNDSKRDEIETLLTQLHTSPWTGATTFYKDSKERFNHPSVEEELPTSSDESETSAKRDRWQTSGGFRPLEGRRKNGTQLSRPWRKAEKGGSEPASYTLFSDNKGELKTP